MHSRPLLRIVRTTIVSLALAATTSLSAQMVNETRPYSGSIQNPCNGEMVAFSGSIHYHEKRAVLPDGRTHLVTAHTINVTGTGQSTGTRYNITGKMLTNSKLPTFPIIFRSRNRFISTTTAPSFHMTTAYTINGNGVQTNAAGSSDCQG